MAVQDRVTTIRVRAGIQVQAGTLVRAGILEDLASIRAGDLIIVTIIKGRIYGN